jgi:hypothetical protein
VSWRFARPSGKFQEMQAAVKAVIYFYRMPNFGYSKPGHVVMADY